RPEDARFRADDFPTGETQQSLHIGERQPVLWRREGLGAEALGKREQGAPETVLKIEDQPRPRGGIVLNAFEKGLHVRQIVNKVRKDDVIERLVAPERRRVGLVEFQFRVSFAGQRERRRAEIHPYAAGRLDGRQQVANAATQFEHALAGWDDEGKVFFEQAMVEAPGRALAPGGALFVE